MQPRNLPLTGTPGGLRLKTLREASGKSQLTVELEANLGLGYLQRLERGKVRQPERDTLERILAALEVESFIERREILALFGYTFAPMPPTETEVHWAIQVFQSQVTHDTLPAYLLDCSHRLLAWNALALKLFSSLTPAVLMPQLIFDSVGGIATSVLNPESFFAAQIRILDYEHQHFGNEAWYGSFVSDMCHYQVFNEYWHKHTLAHPAPVSMRPPTDLKLALNGGVAQFHLIAEPLSPDDRFRVIYYLPADRATILLCLDWQQ